MAAPRLALLAGLLLAMPLQVAEAQATGVTPHLVATAAGYGSEAWKDEPPLGALPLDAAPVPLPADATGVIANPYANATRLHAGPKAWLGANLTARVELRDASGRTVATPSQTVDGRLETAAGDIPAKVARTAPGRFVLTLDLDGENGAPFPAAPAGLARLVVDVLQPTTPGSPPTKLATSSFPIDVRAGLVDRVGFRFDDVALPGYGDVGAGNQTAVLEDAAVPGRPLAFAARLGAPDAPALVTAWRGAEATFQQEARTDAQGRLALDLDVDRIAGGARSAFVIVEAHLAGLDGVVGSAPIAVPVSAVPSRVAAFAFREGSVQGEPLPMANHVVVRVLDAAGAQGDRAAGGNLTVLDRDGRTLAAVPFQPSADNVHEAAIPTTLLPPGELTQYRVVALFVGQDGAFHSLAQAVRGYGVIVDPTSVRPFERGQLPILVRNFANNFDDQRDDGMRLVVKVRVEGLPGGGPHEAQANVEESGEARLLVPFSGDAGLYTVNVNTTSGELSKAEIATVLVSEPPRGLFGLPGFEPLLALAGLAAAAWAQRRRQRA